MKVSCNLGESDGEGWGTISNTSEDGEESLPCFWFNLSHVQEQLFFLVYTLMVWMFGISDTIVLYPPNAGNASLILLLIAIHGLLALSCFCSAIHFEGISSFM